MTDTTDSMPLTIADHTLLMQAMLDRPLHILGHLQPHAGSRPSQEQVLDAALKVASFDAPTKSRLRRVRALLPALEAGKADLPAAFLDAISALRDDLSGASMDEKFAAIGRARSDNQSDSLIVAGIDFAEQILTDGAQTLYSPDGPLAELVGFLGPTFSALGDVAAVDAIGGAIGGGIGLLAAGIGAVPGAAAGAAGGSAGALVGEAIIAVIEIASA